jgi:hypothetical protein
MMGLRGMSGAVVNVGVAMDGVGGDADVVSTDGGAVDALPLGDRKLKALDILQRNFTWLDGVSCWGELGELVCEALHNTL